MNPNATFGIAITADDKTAKGFNSAEKRGQKTAAKLGGINKAWAKEVQSAGVGGGRSLIGTFAGIEKAAGGAFRAVAQLGGGGGSIIGQLASMRGAASVLGKGMAGAATEAGALEAGIVGVGGAAAATGGAIVGLAAGMGILADKWGKGAANLGNMASMIGVSTAELQKFAGAAERVGVDKDTAMGTMGSLSQTLNDARYGRNTGALAVLGKMGVRLQTKQDGTVDVAAMLPAIANALSAQNSSGRRTAASALGIPLSALPAFSQGGKALTGDMTDFGKNGSVLTEADVQVGRALTRRDKIIEQRFRRTITSIQRGNAGIVKGVGDAIVDGSGYSSPIAEALSRGLVGAAGAQTLPVAGGADGGSQAAAGSGFRGRGRAGRTLYLTPQSIVDLKKTVQTEWAERYPDQGHGIIDTILNRDASGHWGRSIRSVVDARSQFSDINGRVAWRQGRHSVAQLPSAIISRSTDRMVDDWLARRAAGTPSSVGDNLNYANPFSSDRKNTGRGGWVSGPGMNGPHYGEGRFTHVHGTTPDNERYRPGDFNVALPQIPVHVTVEVHDKRISATVTTKAGGGRRPAISHAWDHR